MSGRKAWGRSNQKQSPSKKILISPIKPICYHAVSDALATERYTEAHIWTLVALEEFYYQNSCAIVYQNAESEKSLLKNLKDTRVLVDWGNRMENYEIIGKGSFGLIYRATDSITGNMYALKRIIQGEKQPNEDAEDFISTVLIEKTTLFELNKCPFFVRLVGAFQDNRGTAYWFVMEYCLCDLERIVRQYKDYNDNDALWDSYLNEDALVKVNRYMTKTLKVNYKDTMFIYIFEMLLALTYMAQKNIIHADLKPDNVMISSTGHIKVGDLGVSFRDSWYYRNSLTIIARDEKDKEDIDAVDSSLSFRGNQVYFDPEIIIKSLSMGSEFLYRLLLQMYEDNESFQKATSFDQGFLSDLYAVGLISVNALFGGLNVMSSPSSHPVLKYPFWPIDIVYNKEIHKEFITNTFFDDDYDEGTASVMKFLLSIFRPRRIRSKSYAALKHKFLQSELFPDKFINLEKIEKILYYKQKSITRLNVLNMRLPGEYLKRLGEFVHVLPPEDQSKTKPEIRKVFNIPAFGFSDTRFLNK